MVAYVTAAVHGAKDHDLADYLPRWHEEVRQVDVEGMVEKLKRLANRGGG
jgi:hypothetical protein